MLHLMIIIFALGYLAIAFEHPIKIDKAPSALITGVLVWTVFVFTGTDIYFIEKELLHHLSEIGSILFFLLGAMTIVEVIDEHQGFSIITDKIVTKNKVKLLWIICILTFFFSAILDNLATSIVMVSLLRKLISDKYDRWFFLGIVIIAANAGGAWSPIGDITTTMLWIGGQLSAPVIIGTIFIPSLFTLLIPLLILSFTMKGDVERPKLIEDSEHSIITVSTFERNLIFYLGVSSLLFVPVFKIVTGLPPFMGMMLSLGIIWLVTEIIHKSKNTEYKSKLTVFGVLKKVDISSVLFFLGILLAVSGLQSSGHLSKMASSLDNWFSGDIYSINIIIGLLSAIVDNVPLVAGSMGMYEVTSVGDFAVDGKFWQFLAYCAGTGGSALIIGSAAGVAVMGIEKIDFVWYIKKISILALIGYFSGAFIYILLQ